MNPARPGTEQRQRRRRVLRVSPESGHFREESPEHRREGLPKRGALEHNPTPPERTRHERAARGDSFLLQPAMTVIVVTKKSGYVAIAADTLTKWGYRKEPAEYVVNHEKILKVGSSYVGMAGSATGDLALRDYFSKSGAKANFGSVEEIFRVWNRVHRALKENYFLNAEEKDERAFESSHVDVLIANYQGIFGVSSYRMVQEFSRFYAYGSGSEYAMGAMYAVYENAEMTAESIARIGVQAAAEFDENTGLPITSYVVKQRKS